MSAQAVFKITLKDRKYGKERWLFACHWVYINMTIFAICNSKTVSRFTQLLKIYF